MPDHPFVPLRLSRLEIDVDKNWEGKNITNVGTLYGQKEVVSVEERLTKQILTPTTAGDVALTVRDVANTEDRVLLQEDGRMFIKPTTAPVSPKEGDIYYDSAAKAIYYYDGTAWKAFGISKLSELAIDIDKNWGGYNITNLGAGAHDVNAKLDEIATKVSKAGDVMTGRLYVRTISPQLYVEGKYDAAAAAINLDAATGNLSGLRFLEAGTAIAYMFYDPAKAAFVFYYRDILPEADNARSLGSASYRWSRIYSPTYYLDAAGQTRYYIAYDPIYDLKFYNARTGNWFYLAGALVCNCDVVPRTDNTYSLGSSGNRWSNLYAVVTTIGDLILEGKDAKWKITEGKDGIYAEDLKNGKKFKLKMEEVRE